MMRVTIDKDLYLKTIEQSTDVSVFYKAPWLDAVCPLWSAAVVQYDEVVVAALPFSIEVKYGLKKIGIPFFTPTLDIIHFEQGHEAKNAKAILAALPHASYYHFIINEVQSNSLFWKWKGFQQTTRYTFKILPKPVDQVYAVYESTTQSDIRFASKSLEVSFEPDVDVFYNLIVETYKKQNKKPLLSKQMLHKIVNNMGDFVSIYVAKDTNGTAHAGVLILEDVGVHYNLFSGKKVDGIRGANALVLHHAIDRAMSRGVVFDFEGSSIQGVYHFFKSFGGDLYQTSSVWKSSKLLSLMIAK